MTTHDARAEQAEFDLVQMTSYRDRAIEELGRVTVSLTARAEKAEKDRDGLEEELVKVAALLHAFEPQHAHTTPRWKSLPERPAVQATATWAVEKTVQLLREELQHGPPDKRNRMTVSISWADEDWNLTLSIGNYEHAVEKARDEARLAVERLHQELAVVEAERDELRATLAANQKA